MTSGRPAAAAGEPGELVVVVGATGAFGRVIVDRLVGEGYRVVAVGRDGDRLSSLAAQHDGAVVPCPTDISDDAAIDDIARAIAEAGSGSGPTTGDGGATTDAAGDRGSGPTTGDGGATTDAAGNEPVVRAVVHGPGVLVAGGIMSAPTAAIITSVDIKVGGLLRLVRAADPHLVEGSRIIAIAGHYGLEPTRYAAAAGVANAALFNAVRQLSLAYGERGVTAHTLAPGPADTERLRRVAQDRATMSGSTPEAVLDAMRAESSIGRLTTPEQVAWAVSMLLAPEAAAMTGSAVMLDSGRRRGLP